MSITTTLKTNTSPDLTPGSRFPLHQITVDRYERMVAAGIFTHKEPIFLWHGRLVEKINESVPPTTALTYPTHFLTVDRYLRMVEAGIFGAKEPIFLWHGRLVEKMTKGLPHTYCLITLYKLFDHFLPEGWHARQETPMILDDGSVPEPDISVVRGSPEDYLQHHPSPQDITLLVEIADSSLASDSKEVLQTYVRNGIPSYWLVNIPKRRVEVYTEPSRLDEPPYYRQCRYFGPGEEVPIQLDGREAGRVAVDRFMPR